MTGAEFRGAKILYIYLYYYIYYNIYNNIISTQTCWLHYWQMLIVRMLEC